MRREGLRVAIAALAFLVATRTPSARAQSQAASDPAAALAEAKELFRKGVAVFTAGDVERALDYFRRSRAIVASKQNTIDIAICLDRLGRYDEALEMYEEVIATYGSALTAEEQQTVPRSVATLQTKVGALDVAANVSGTVVVDGRERGRLPLTASIRVVPGAHVVRVLKDGYMSFETRIDVAAGAVRAVDARLEPLSAAGGLRVEDVSLAATEVIVDGVRVGAAPWEGTLAPGPHIVVSQSEGRASVPTLAVVLQGQTALLRLRSAPVGPVMRVTVSPPTARLRLGGVPIGYGTWEGNLPPGRYAVTADEEGYIAKSVTLDVPERGDAAPRAMVTLAVDPSHPRWPKAPSRHILFDASVAYGLSPSLHSGVEARCTTATACDRGPPSAALFALRSAYEFPVGLSIGVTGGYLLARAPLKRVLSDQFASRGRMYPVRFSLADDIRLSGFLVGPSVGFRKRVAQGWSAHSAAAAGILLATSRDPISGTASTGAESVVVAIEHAGDAPTSRALFTTFEVGIEHAWGAWQIGAGVMMLAVPGHGPVFPREAIVTPSNCGDANPGAVGCTPAMKTVEGESAYGPFLFVMPQIHLTWTP